MSDNEKIPAEDWTFVGKSLRRLALFSDRNGTADAQSALADIAEQKAKWAREREEREDKCKRGEHEWFFGADFGTIRPGRPAVEMPLVTMCAHCKVRPQIPPAPIPNPSAADIAAALSLYDDNSEWDGSLSACEQESILRAADNVIRAMIREFAERRGIK